MRHGKRGSIGIGELGAIFIVMSIVAFMLYSWVNRQAEVGKRQITIERMNAISEALIKYHIDTGGMLPTQNQSLQALLEKPDQEPIPLHWNGPYLDGPEYLVDGWGRPFHYITPGRPLAKDAAQTQPYELYSYGRDGMEGGEEMDRDISLWDAGTMVP